MRFNWREMVTAPRDGSLIYVQIGIFTDQVCTVRWNENRKKVPWKKDISPGWEKRSDRMAINEPQGWMTWSEYREATLKQFKEKWETMKAEHHGEWKTI